MKTRIVLKSFQALSPAALAEGDQAGKGGSNAPSEFARHSQPSANEAKRIPVHFQHFMAPGQRTGWQATLNSALNDVEI